MIATWNLNVQARLFKVLLVKSNVGRKLSLDSDPNMNTLLVTVWLPPVWLLILDHLLLSTEILSKKNGTIRLMNLESKLPKRSPWKKFLKTPSRPRHGLLTHCLPTTCPLKTQSSCSSLADGLSWLILNHKQTNSSRIYLVIPKKQRWVSTAARCPMVIF